MDSKPSYVVSEVVDSRQYGNAKSKYPPCFVQYLVAWERYRQEENSWEPFEMSEGTAMQALVDFQARYPSKPRDHRVVDEPAPGNKR